MKPILALLFFVTSAQAVLDWPFVNLETTDFGSHVNAFIGNPGKRLYFFVRTPILGQNITLYLSLYHPCYGLTVHSKAATTENGFDSA
jgi:hypothetical protein